MKWVKRLAIALVVIVVLAGAVIAFAIYNANSLIASMQPQLEKRLSATLNTPVSLGKIDVSVFPKTSLKVDELLLGDKKAPGGGLGLKNVTLDLALAPLLSKKLEITSLSITDPRITIIKDANGVRLEGLGGAAPAAPQASSSAPSAPPQPKSSEAAPPPAPSALDLNLERLQVKNGTVRFVDSVANKEYLLDRIEVDSSIHLAGDLATVKTLTFAGRALSSEKLSIEGENLTFDLGKKHLTAPKIVLGILDTKFHAKADLDVAPPRGTLHVDNGVIDLVKAIELLKLAGTDLSHLGAAGTIKPVADVTLLDNKDVRLKLEAAVDDLKAGLPTASVSKASASISAEATKPAEGELRFTSKTTVRDTAAKIPNATIDGLATVITASGTPAKQEFRLDETRLSYNGQPITGSIAGTFGGGRLSLSKVDLNGFGGTIDTSADLSLEASKNFSSKFQLKSLELTPLLAAFAPAMKDQFSGTLAGVSGSIRGSAGGALLASLDGGTRLDLRSANIKGYNLAASVLRSVNSLPFMQGSLLEAMGGSSYGLQGDNTPIQLMVGDIKLGGSKISTDNLKVTSDLFELEGAGTLGFDTSMNLNATIYFNQRFSEAMTGRVKELKRVLDAQGRLVIPLTLSGKPPKLLIVPNLKKLLEMGLKTTARDQAQKLLERKLGEKTGLPAGQILEGLFGR